MPFALNIDSLQSFAVYNGVNAHLNYIIWMDRVSAPINPNLRKVGPNFSKEGQFDQILLLCWQVYQTHGLHKLIDDLVLDYNILDNYSLIPIIH